MIVTMHSNGAPLNYTLALTVNSSIKRGQGGSSHLAVSSFPVPWTLYIAKKTVWFSRVSTVSRVPAVRVRIRFIVEIIGLWLALVVPIYRRHREGRAGDPATGLVVGVRARFFQ